MSSLILPPEDFLDKAGKFTYNENYGGGLEKVTYPYPAWLKNENKRVNDDNRYWNAGYKCVSNFAGGYNPFLFNINKNLC